MAKIYGINGVITGKLGAAVYAVRNGEQISRQYQPIVSNPSTSAQIAARAKLKLMSQLSAVMAPVIAIPRMGAVSSRNMFVKANYGATVFENNQADITLTDVKLTTSVVSFPGVFATRGAAGYYVSLDEKPADMSRVVFVMFEKRADNTLRMLGSQVVSVGNDTPTANFNVPTNNAIVVYSYGIRDNSDAARAKFGDMTVLSAETVAKVVVSRTLTEVDITLSETVAATLDAPTNP